MKKINILTGPTQSGKTTRLITWVKFHKHIAGILSPVLNNQRYLYSILKNDYRRLEAPVTEIMDDEIISIGKYSFLQSAFSWARKELTKAIEVNPSWLIIDEIGPLEMSGKGLEPAVSKVLKKFKRSADHRLILVVRERMLEEVISGYQLQNLFSLDINFLDIK